MIVEQATSQNLIKVETDSVLILRSMLAEKKKDMAKPRERVMTQGNTPRRIRKIISEHEKREVIVSEQTGKPVRPKSSVMNRAQLEDVVDRRSLAK